MPNGTGVSNIDLSRSPSHSLSLVHFHRASLSPRFTPSTLHRAHHGCEQLRGTERDEGEGRVHQEVPAKAQERRTFTSRTNTRTCTYHRCESCPDCSSPIFEFPTLYAADSLYSMIDGYDSIQMNFKMHLVTVRILDVPITLPLPSICSSQISREDEFVYLQNYNHFSSLNAVVFFCFFLLELGKS